MLWIELSIGYRLNYQSVIDLIINM